MAGIYLHIPFCHSKCHYCNFYSGVSLKYMDAFVDSILIEIDRRKDYLKDEEISTIYFGGGTPSVLSAEKLDLILSRLKSVFDISKDCEITLEANPEDIKEEFISQIKTLGVNRLSIGCQAFDNVLLKNLNIVHN